MRLATPDWSEIDTAFLDMDGTLLDLHFDNQVWNQAVPEAFALSRNIDPSAARQLLFEHMGKIRGSIEFLQF